MRVRPVAWALAGVVALSLLALAGAAAYVRYRAGRDAAAAAIYRVGDDLGALTFVTAEGERIALGEREPVPAVLVFWASWCPGCKKHLGQIDEARAAVRQSGGELYLIDKLDGEKETVSSALGYLESKGIQTSTLFDEGLAAYRALGLRSIPTTVVLGADNRLTQRMEGKVPSASELADLLAPAEGG